MNSNADERPACALTPFMPEDVKPQMCAHGFTVETCTVPECATFEISKILDTLQNFERNVEGTSPLAADKPVFDFEGPQPTSPSQWEDFSFWYVGDADYSAARTSFWYQRVARPGPPAATAVWCGINAPPGRRKSGEPAGLGKSWATWCHPALPNPAWPPPVLIYERGLLFGPHGTKSCANETGN